LRQRKGVSEVKDGMDISICALDRKTNHLQYSGAFNPLYRIRDDELEITRANKFPIGAFLGEDLQEFDNHEMKTKKGDVYYIFSDGYADQFGGPKGKKLKYKQFQSKLMEIHKKPMEEQKQILNEYIMDWMGDLEQIDDILVIGIRI